MVYTHARNEKTGDEREACVPITGPLTADDLRAIAAISTPTVANAIETFDIQPRNTGFMNPTIRPVVLAGATMVGYACTAKIRAANPATPSVTATRRQMWEHILAMPAPRVVVLEDLDDPPVGAFWGEVQANIHRALGCVGTVTSGGVRDLDEVRALGFTFFAGSVMVSHAYVHIVEIGCPVHVGGVTVRPGDLMHGDQHGVAIVPAAVARDLPAAARSVEARERTIIDLCKSDTFSLERLSELYR